MYDFVTIFFTGMLISFLGTLPLGTLNVSAMQLSVQENTRNAVKFALGVALVEIIYVRISLKGMNWVMEHQTVFRVLEWITVLLFIVLAISSFRTARKKEGDQKNIVLKNNLDRFLLGFTMSAINPVQIPFWFIWSTYLLSNKFLLPKELHFNIYTAGIGIGTLIALAFFIFAGKWIITRLKASHRAINMVVGFVFLLSAGIQLYRLLTSGGEVK
ncbi:MAG: LysE family transporter [Chitinophagaceae bacterium]|nr:LysE family transporter [Chitinophagaceae bacterium]